MPERLLEIFGALSPCPCLLFCADLVLLVDLLLLFDLVLTADPFLLLLPVLRPDADPLTLTLETLLTETLDLLEQALTLLTL